LAIVGIVARMERSAIRGWRALPVPRLSSSAKADDPVTTGFSIKVEAGGYWMLRFRGA
jgi:hypothetical protein